MSSQRKALIVGAGPIADAIAKRLESQYSVIGIRANAPEAVKTLVDDAVQKIGGVDVLVNALESDVLGGTLDTTAQAMGDAFSARIGVMLAAVSSVVPHMDGNPEGGRILNLAGARGHLATGGHLVEATLSAAVSAMTREMAMDLEPHKISVNAISPWMLTPTELAASDEKTQKKFTDLTLMDRLITPEDVAIMAEFLVSQDAFTVDAYDMMVDGGMSIFRSRMEESWFENPEYYH